MLPRPWCALCVPGQYDASCLISSFCFYSGFVCLYAYSVFFIRAMCVLFGFCVFDPGSTRRPAGCRVVFLLGFCVFYSDSMFFILHRYTAC